MPYTTTQSLYKYLPAEIACAVLEQGALRWSSPDLFGDPFELTSQSGVEFTGAVLLESTINVASSMIFAPEQPKGDSPLIHAINRWRGEGRFDSAEEAHGVLRDLLSKMVEYRLNQLHDALNLWQAYVRNARFCCFCSAPDILTAWESYAAKHTGVALRFSIDDNSPFRNAKPVVYQAERAELTTKREQLACILNNRKDKIIERFGDHHFIKPEQKKNEKEWRCFKSAEKQVSVDNIETETWFDDVAYTPQTLTAVYFGLCTSDTDLEIISKIAASHYPSAKLFQAVKARSGFQIEFEKIVV